VNGRNFTFLAQLGAGMQTPQADTRGNAASGAVLRQRPAPAQNNYLLDGIDNNSNAVDFSTNQLCHSPPLGRDPGIQGDRPRTSALNWAVPRRVINATISPAPTASMAPSWEYFPTITRRRGLVEDNGGTAGRIAPESIRRIRRRAHPQEQDLWFGDTKAPPVRARLRPARSPRRRTQHGYTIYPTFYAKLRTARTIWWGAPYHPARFWIQPRRDTLPRGDGSNLRPHQQHGQCGYVRDPFGTCGASTTTFTASAGGLNQIPSSRLDSNAIKLLETLPVANLRLGDVHVEPAPLRA